MESKLISMTNAEYIGIYRQYKDIVNPNYYNMWGETHTNSAHMQWYKIGLEYYETNENGKKFKVLDHKKWMHHLMLAKIAN